MQQRLRDVPRYGYNHVETNEEVMKRLKAEGTISRMRQKFDDETFDQWLELNGQTRKMTYVP
jgi:hypothetical protein